MENKEIEGLVEAIAAYSGGSDRPYIEIFNREFIIELMQLREEIQTMERQFREKDIKGLDIVDFISVFLNMFPHYEDETLYIVIGLTDFFKDICEYHQLTDTVRPENILDFVVSNYLNKNRNDEALNLKLIPQKNIFQKRNDIRVIDIDPPPIYGNTVVGIRRLETSKLISDSFHHFNGQVKQATFAIAANQVFTLDAMSDSICVYGLDCHVQRKLKPKSVSDREAIILDFAYSEKQQRIGACLKDYALSFWENNDGFTFEKSVLTAKAVNDFQRRIWFIEFLDTWITVDKTNNIYIWDIDKEKVVDTLFSPKFEQKAELKKANNFDQVQPKIPHLKVKKPAKQVTSLSDKSGNDIIDIRSIDIMKLIAVSSMDKFVRIWNPQKRMIVSTLNLTDGGVHSIAWSAFFQVFITAGFQSTIKFWKINPNFLDCAQVSTLVGHEGMVTAVEVIENTPMIVSADDQGTIKLWDMRNMGCIQSLGLGQKMSVTKILNLYERDKLCLIGSRVSFLDFQEAINPRHVIEPTDKLWPVKVEYSHDSDELIVCTNKDVRFIDGFNGRVKKLYTGFFNDADGVSDLTALKMIQQNKKFILGNNRGKLACFNCSDGELYKRLFSHTNEVNNLKFDFFNKLLISNGHDGNFYIHHEGKLGYEAIKKVKNMHNIKEVTVFEFSVHHNVFVTAANTHQLYLWDYEFARIVAYLQIEEQNEFTSACFITGYGILIVGDSLGRIFFIKFDKKELNQITFEYLGMTNSNLLQVTQAKTSQKNEKNEPSFITKMFSDVDIHCTASGTFKGACDLYMATNKGEIKIISLLEFMTANKFQFMSHTSKRMNYNPLRNIQENFATQLNAYKIHEFDLVRHFDKTQLQFQIISGFSAHRESLTNFNFLYGGSRFLLTSSFDGALKIFTKEGRTLACLDINHPLPSVWRFKDDHSEKHKQQILMALKLIENVRVRNKSDLKHKQNWDITPFLNKLTAPVKEETMITLGAQPPVTKKKKKKPQQKEEEVEDEDEENDQINREALERIRKRIADQRNVKLMSEEYDPRDLLPERIRKLFQDELQGSSLKQMEYNKKVHNAQKAWRDILRENEMHDRIALAETIERNDEEKKERANFFNFLFGDNRISLDDGIQYSKGTQLLSKKLDHAISKKKLLRSTVKRKESVFEAVNKLLISKLTSRPSSGRSSSHSQDRSPHPENKQSQFRSSLASDKMPPIPQLKSPTNLERLRIPDSIKINTDRPIPHVKNLVNSGTDFFQYASSRLGNQTTRSSEVSTKFASELGNSNSSNTLENKKVWEATNRKNEKRGFNGILKLMEDQKKRSMGRVSLYKKLAPLHGRSASQTFTNSDMTQTLFTPADKTITAVSPINMQVNPSFLSPKNVIGNDPFQRRNAQKEFLKASKDFREELIGMQEKLAQDWNITPNVHKESKHQRYKSTTSMLGADFSANTEYFSEGLDKVFSVFGNRN